MISLIRKTFLLTFIAMGLFSCSKESLDPVASQSEDFTMSSPLDGAYTLLASNAGEEAFIANWTSADYKFQAAVKYYLQLVKATDAFSDIQSENPSLELGNYSSIAGATFEKSITVRQFNTLVLAANPSGIGVAGSYKTRIVGVVNGQLDSSDNNLANAKSQEGTITVTAYDAFDEFDRLFNIGNGSLATPSNALTILKNGLTTLPSVTNGLITGDTSGKAIVTKEFTDATYAKFSAVKPSSETDFGKLGEIRMASGYVYFCYATNLWMRIQATPVTGILPW